MISSKLEKKDVEKAVEFLQKREKVCALLAPTVEKTLGDPVQKEMFYRALSDAGFFTWRQIAEEADQLASQEVEEWESRTEDKKIIISSSCPAIVRLVEKEYPELSVYLSSTKSPMHLASFKVKEENANVKTVFIGPCYWKKEEQKRLLNEKGHVDVVLTFEEFIEVLKNLKMDFEWEYTSVDKEIVNGENIDMPGQMAFCVQEKMQKMQVKAMPRFLTGAGIDECKKILNAVRHDEYKKCYIELLACKKGCGVKE